MRALYIVILGFVLLFSISITANHYLGKSSEILQVELRVVEEQLLSEDWAQALFRLEDIEIKWTEYKSWWAVFLNHATLNNIEISINRLEQYIITEDKSLSLAELSELLIILEDISDAERLKLYNIF